MSRTKTVYRTLREIAAIKSKQGRIEALQAINTVNLRNLLICMYDPNVKIMLPPGDPPYKANRAGENEGTLWRELRKLQYLVEGQGGENLRAYKREQLYLTMLETVDPEDAELLIMMANKRPVKGLTAATINEALGPIISEKKVEPAT